MPTLDGLARQGLRYTNFHTTALCSPTRAALKAGRNHHTVNMGFITEMATSFPGATGQIPNATAPLAEILRLNGYSTAAFGKWHETAVWEASNSGPFDRWPTRQGFDKFYGFIGGESNQWAPFLYDGVAQVELPDDPHYHFLTDMTDKAVSWIKYQKALTPDKPAFIYFAPGATHAPHHVPKKWIDRWQGKLEQGWDKLRAETLARQINMGIVPLGTELAAKPSVIKDWDTLSSDQRRLFAKQAQVFAAYAEFTDHEIGRLLNAFEDIGQADNTLVIYVAGDNGTSGEGGANGMFNEYTYFNGVQEKVEDMLKVLDKWGGPETYPHMAAGWSVALDAPFGWMKQVPSDFGGTRNGMVMHWPRGINAKNEIRSQFSHVIDIAPTVLEAIALPEPKVVNGTPQIPMEGIRLQSGKRYRSHEPKEASRASGALLERGREVPCTANRRPGIRAPRCERGRAAGSNAWPYVPDPRRGNDRNARSCLYQCQEPVENHHRRDRNSEGRRQWHDPGAGRALRRMVAIRERWCAGIRLQLPRSAARHDCLRNETVAREKYFTL
jgi:arylsulfatase